MNRAFKKIFLALLAAAVATGGLWFLLQDPIPSVQAATCPFVDGDANDGSAVAGTYQLNTNFAVSAAATAYDCTSASGITTFIVPNGVTLTLNGNVATGEIAQMNFTNLTVNTTGKISADGKGCVAGTGNGFGPNGSNICTVSTAGFGTGASSGNPGGGGGGHGGAGGRGVDGGSTFYAGGPTYDSSTAPAFFGSSGGSATATYPGGAGGGVVKLSVTGTFTNDGLVSANGSNGVTDTFPTSYASGGGSGGTVSVTTASITGSGTFSANGGNGGDLDWYRYGGGGGGGRVAIVYDTNAGFTFSASSLTVTAGIGGNGPPGPGQADNGAKGTVYVVDDQATGPATDDAVQVFHGFTWTDTDYSVASWATDPLATNQYCDLAIAGSATPSVTTSSALVFDGTFNCGKTISLFTFSSAAGVSTAASSVINVPGAVTLTSSGGPLSVGASSTLTSAGTLTLSGNTAFTLGTGATITDATKGTNIDFILPAGSQTWTNVTINGATEGFLTVSSSLTLTLSGTTSVKANVQWTTLANLTVDASASINANTKGCQAAGSANGYGPNGSNVCTVSTAGFGTGANSGNPGAGGGGHGGAGGRGIDYPSTYYAGGPTYDSPTAPVLFGSSGGSATATYPGGAGGGIVKLVISGTLTNNGVVSANGGNGAGNTSFTSGGGSGGTVNVATAAITGSGTFAANGGNGGDVDWYRFGGGGGGGRVAIVYNTNSGFTFNSTTLTAAAGLGGSGPNPVPTSADNGGKGTVYIVDDQATGPATDDDVQIFHGFTWTDTDYSVASWTTDTSTTNQYCDPGIAGSATPSLTTSSALVFAGTFNCGMTITSFTLSSSAGVSTASSTVITVTGNVTFSSSGGALATGSSSNFTITGTFTMASPTSLSIGASSTISVNGTMTLSGTSSFSMGSGVTLTETLKGANIALGVPAASSTQTWTGVTINGAAEGFVTIGSTASLTLNSTTAVKANVQWTTLTDLTVDGTSSINANTKGCQPAGSANGYGPNGSNVCTVTTAGYGTGSATGNPGAGGGGHGGAGGRGVDYPATFRAGGPAYDSATVPALFGSSGGSATATYPGGAGGGLIVLVVSGTFTDDGIISANGGNGTTDGGTSSYTSGGGSGGAIHASVGAITGSGTLTANGGNGGDSNWYRYGGGGGGGRIAVDYGSNSGFSFGTAATVTAGGIGGSGTNPVVLSADNGANGTLTLTQTDPPPTVTIVTHTPASPFTTDSVTLSGTATDNAGIIKIEIFLDGTAPANLKHTCNIAPTTPATCSIGVGTLSGGSHTTTIRAYDAALQMGSGTETFSVGGSTTAGQMILGRSKVGTSTSFTLAFALSGTSTGTLTVTFPVQFTVTAAGSGGASSGCLSSFGFTSTTLTATKTACSGTVTLGGATITNPVTPGTYVINWTNDSGSGSVYITSDDQVGVSANVDPVLTFNVGSQASATACDGTFTGNGGTIALGVIATGAVTSSDAASVAHICTRVTTNGTLGANITVKSLNASLKSTSTPADAIPSSTTTLVAGTAGYGLCAGSAGGDSGKDTTVPVGATPTRSAPFNGASCTASGHDIGQLTTSAQNLWTLAAASQNAFFRLYIKAAISPTTPAHNDYSDTLTFVATGTY